MSNNINFLKKKTVLNDILSNRNVSVINNTKYDPNDENDKGLLLNTINNAETNTDKYIISYDNVDLNISYNDIKELYRSKSWLSNNQVSFDEFKDNVNYYNNYNKNGIQDLTYTKYDQSLNTNTLLIDNTYNSLYYVRPDKINLMSYSIKNKDGFNYDENNHVLKFNIDNNYIKSINNLLYYNYNNIRNTSSDKTGIASIDDKFFDVKNYNNSYSNNILTINKEFKTEIYSTLNKIKNLYNDCKVIYNKEKTSQTITENGENNKIGGININNTEIRFEDPKLYYDDDVVGVNSLDLANADTLYVFDLDNADFRLGYTDTLDYDYKENQYTSNASANSLSNDVKNSTLKNRISLTLSENDASANIIANQHIKSNHVIGTTYNIDLGDISKNSFNANGLSILYKASPYKISTEDSGQLITIPYDKELNIRKIAGTFGKYFYTTEIERIAEYLFVSSHYDIKGFRIPDSSFDYLKSRNTITDIFNLQYYSVLKAGYGYPEVYPILNLYPNNYINEKYFDSDLISYYDENNDTAYSEIIATEDELSTCVSKIRDIYLDDVKCLYFYKLLHKDGYYETVGEPNMLIFEEDIDSYLTFIARNDVQFTFTVPKDAEDNAKYIQFSLDGVTWEYLIDNTIKKDNNDKIIDKGVIYKKYTYINNLNDSNNGKIRSESNIKIIKTNNENLTNNFKYSKIENKNEYIYRGENGFGDNQPDNIKYIIQTTNNITYITIASINNLIINLQNELRNDPENNEKIEKLDKLNNALNDGFIYEKTEKNQYNIIINETFIKDFNEHIENINDENVVTYNSILHNDITHITYTLNHTIENSNKILWRAKFYNFKLSDDHKYIEDIKDNNDNLSINDKPYYVYPQYDYITATPNLANGIGTFGAICSNGDPKFEIFGNSMSLIYGCPYIEYVDEISNEKTNVYCTKLSDKPHIFDKLFSGSYIVSATRLALPATSLEKSNFCYQEMFLNCDHLTDSPKLAAEILADRCYKGMFKNCIGLQSAPRLDALTMKPECYKEMFRGCKALLMPPNVTKKYPTGIFMSKELAYGCYESMFEGCENLRVMPQLTASKMKENCYKKMFKDCGQIGKAVNLPVIQEFAKSCFYFMFYKTQIIPHIVTSGLKINLCEGLYFNAKNNNEQEKFVNNVKIGALQGIFGGTNIEYIELAKFLPKDKHNNAYLNTYLNETYNNLDVECYLDMFYNAVLLDKAPYLPATEMKKGCYYRMFYGCHSLQYIPEFTINTSAEECCYQMFYEAGTNDNNYLTFRNSGFINPNDELEDIIKLSLSNNTDVLSKKCYYQMFFGCDKLYDYNLEDQPIQVITTIGGISCEEQSCESMFEGCAHIKYTTSSLPATTLAEASYKNMYKNCSALIYGPSIAATIVAKESCMSMFEGCTLLTNTTSSLSATILYEATYKNMYKSCSSLTHGPQINAQILANQCCMSMFEGCTSLKDTTSSLPATILKDECYKNMYKNCRSLSVAPSIDNPENTTKLAKECCMSMFEGCKALIKSPDLLATKLVENCYERMFYGCKNLIFIKALFLTAPMNEANATTIVNDSVRAFATESWVQGVKNFDVKDDLNYIDTFEDYNKKYSNGLINQIDFTTELKNSVNTIEHRAESKTWDDISTPEVENNSLGRFVRNSEASWIVKENIGVDGIPSTWNVYKGSIKYNNKEYPIFVFFHSNSHRNNEDFSKLIYGFPGDIYNGVPTCPIDFDRRGHTFKGWSLNEGALNDEQSNIVSMTNITFGTTDVNYYAVWEANECNIVWHYIVDQEYTTTTQGIYETPVKNYIPDPNNTLYNLTTPVPTHQYPKNNQNIQKDGYIFWCWSSIENPLEQLDHVNPNTPTNYFIRTIYDYGNDLDVDQSTPNSFETDTVGLNGENNFYAVWKYIVKWNVNGGKYSDNNSDRTNDYFYQTYYLYNDPLDFPNDDQEPTRDGDYLFGGWSTIQGPVGNTPYIPNMYTDNIPYTAIQNENYKNGNDNISNNRPMSGIRSGIKDGIDYNVKEPKNYYATWKSAIIWYDGNGEIFVKNYGYYNDKAKKYEPYDLNGNRLEPKYPNRTFVGWAPEPNQREDNLNYIIVHNSGSDDNTIYPVWKYGVVWMTRGNDADANCGYYTAPYTNGYYENRYEQSEYLYEDTLILPDRNPIRDDEDYIFDTTIYNDVWSGWADYAGPQQDKGIWKPNINKNYQVTDSATFYAVYKPAITWYYYENDILTNSKTYGYYYDNALSNSNKLSDPSNNTRYRFIGWNSYPNQREADNDNEIIIKNPASNNIYGVWYYSVKWYTNGGSYSNTGNGYYQNYYYQDNYLYNDNIIKPESNPTRNDYEFAGWSVNQSPSDNNIWKEDTDITNQTKKIIDSIDVYSVWKSAIYWYDYNGNLLATTYGYYNDNITNYTPSDPSRTGYTFQGWNTNSGQSNGNINGVKVGDPSNNKFYAAYTVNIYTIYWYNYDGTTLLKTTTGDYDSYVSLHIPKNDDNTNYEPTREGYTFQGWNTNTNQTSGNIDNIRVNTSGNNFYAAYTVNQMTVTFKVANSTYDYNYGYIDTEGITVKYIYPNYNSKLGTLPTAYGSLKYKQTSRWRIENGDEVNSNTYVTGNMTLIPIPGDVRKFTVTFNLTNSVYESLSISPNYYERYYDEEIGTLPTASDDQGVYNNTNEWKENDSRVYSTTKVYHDMVLTPIRASENEHTVTFHYTDGFSGETTKRVTHGSQIGTLPTATREGYYPITSWKFDNGDDGNLIDSSYEVTSNIDLYMDRTKIQIITCIVTFTVNGTDYESITGATGDGKTMTWPLNYGQHLGEYNNDDGTLPQANDSDGQYEPTRRWKIKDTVTEVTDQTVVKGNMILEPMNGDPQTRYVTFKVTGSSYGSIFGATGDGKTMVWALSYGQHLGEYRQDGTLPKAQGSSQYEDSSRWKLENGSDQEDEFTAQSTITSDITLVPINGDPIKYTVTFMVGNTGYDYIGVSDYPTSYSKNDVTYGTTLGSLFTSGTLPMAYDNDGEYANTDVWKIDGTTTIVTANFEVKSDLTLIPTGSVSKHTVTWHYNYYETGTTFKVETEPDKYYHGSAIGTLKTASRDCAFFDGWYANESFTGNPIDTDYVINDDTHLYLKWNLKEYFRTTFNAKSYSYEATVGLELYSATPFPSYGWEDDTLQYSEDEGLTWNIVTKPTSSSTYITWIIENTSKSIIWRGTQKINDSAPSSIGWLNICSRRIGGGTAGGECDLSGYLSSLVHNNSFVDINNGNIEYKTNGYYYNTFSSLFYNSSSIGSASSLKLNLMGILVYDSMFAYCGSLVYPPILSTFNIIGPACFMGMFSGCISLNEVPTLPNVNLSDSTSSSEVYEYMFKGCISLTTVPNDLLKSTTLTASCYAGMFEGCTALTNAPELPVSTLADECYASMFKGCTSLITAPVLNAETLVPRCYKEMFNGCSSLRKIECYATNISAEDCTTDWVAGVPTDILNGRDVAGDFYRSENNNDWAVFDVNGIPTNWEIHPNLNIITVPWFAITCNISGSNGDGVTPVINVSSSSYSNTDVYYAVNDIYGNPVTSNSENPYWHKLNTGDNWSTITAGGPETEGKTSYSQTFVFKANGHIFFNLSEVYTSNANSNVTVEFSVSGNPITLKAGTNKVIGGGTYNFEGNNTNLFAKDSSSKSTLLTDASNLELYRSDINMISNECYKDMFANCVGLTIPPALPSPTLANNCYEEMFRGCTSLSSLPSLGAQTLAFRCYSHMFGNCSSLTQVPSNYLSITTLEERCYEYMFEGCTALTSAPELPASTLKLGCYQYMFNNCTSLTTLPTDMIKATTLAENCCRWMFHNCSSLTNSDQHLVLHAETLARACYEGMFFECTDLRVIICLATYGMFVSSNSDSENYDPDYALYVRSTEGWVVQDASLNQTIYPNSDGKFYKNSQTEFREQTGSGKNYWGRGGTGVPYEWQVLKYGAQGAQYYNITWISNYDGGPTLEPSTVTAGQSVNAPDISRTDYNTPTWNTDQYGNGTTISFPYTPTGNITLYAQWTENQPQTYTITWNAGGGLFEVLNDNFSHNDLVYDENNNLIGFTAQVSGTIPIPSWTGDDGSDSYKFYRTGYSFVDWYDSPAEPLQQEQDDWADDDPIQSGTIASGNKTYYARWRVNSKQNLVSFEDLENQPLYAEISPLADQESSVDVHVIADYGYANGVANDGKYLTANVIVTSGDALISPSNKEGSGPSGAWSQSLSGIRVFEDVVYSQSTVVPDEPGTGDDSEQHDIEEHHTGIKMFWIKTPNSYNSTSNISVEIIGASGTTNGVSDFTTFRNNYELTTQFSVTTRSSSGGGTPGGDPTEEDEEEEAIYYNVSFDANCDDDITVDDQFSVKANNTISSAVDSLPEPYRSGYTFDGWNTDPNGNGEEVTLNYIVTETIILYAQWS